MVVMASKANDSDPRVKRTRRLLLEAFSALQKEKSISSISVQDIAGRATVNRATFYAHFEDKYALLYSWIREEFREVLAHKVPASSTLTTANLRLLVLTVFDFLAGFYSSCKRSDIQLEPMFETAMQQELCDILLTWLRRIPDTAQPDTLEITAQVVSWAIFGPAVQWSRGDRTLPAEAITDAVMAAILRGLSGVLVPIA